MILRITDPADPRIADYRNVPDPELLRQRGLFVAENRLVVRLLLSSGRFRAVSVLVTDAALSSLTDLLEPLHADLPVYVSPKAMMEQITGFNINRGCLALGERPAPVSVGALVDATPAARRLVVLESVTNADNVGGIFRTGRAFGFEGVVVGPGCCDPLYRKAIRVSIGAALELPFASADDWPSDLERLQKAGFVVAALTPAGNAVDLQRFVSEAGSERVALVVGNEGSGLSAETMLAADVRVRIPMVAEMDSLNANVAAAIAMYALRQG